MKTRIYLFGLMRVLALLGILAARGTWAQDKQLTTLTTSNGCSVLIEKSMDMRKLNWTGECKNSFLEGHGVLSYESSTGQNWGPGWVDAGLMRNGKPEGLWMSASRVHNSICFVSFNSGWRSDLECFSGKIQADNRQNRIYAVKPWLYEWTKGTLNDPRYGYLVAGLDAYYDDTDKFFSGNFKAPNTATFEATPTSTAKKRSNAADDPKVFGRSMRGG
jgi:hypothetical protein